MAMWETGHGAPCCVVCSGVHGWDWHPRIHHAAESSCGAPQGARNRHPTLIAPPALVVPIYYPRGGTIGTLGDSRS
jgi:hypothetical protein